MGRRTKREPIVGTCAICAAHGPLTYEHIPPFSAFNSQRANVETYDEAVARHPLAPVKGRIVQGGVGGHTLCGTCNANTGAWYVEEYASWARQASDLLLKSKGELTLTYLYHGFPARFFKQVVAMFMSVDRPFLTTRYPDMRDYLLNRRSREYDPAVRIYAYYNPSAIGRQSGGLRMYKSDTARPFAGAEIAYYPFGFVLAYGLPPDDRLAEITFLSQYDVDDFRSVPLRLPCLPAVSPECGLYLTNDEVRKAHADIVKRDFEGTVP